jgi:hypothetical protein
MDGLSWSFLCPIYDLRREVVVQFVDIVSILNHYQYIAHTLHLLIVVCLFFFFFHTREFLLKSVGMGKDITGIITESVSMLCCFVVSCLDAMLFCRVLSRFYAVLSCPGLVSLL